MRKRHEDRQERREKDNRTGKGLKKGRRTSRKAKIKR
jgi:hypothetical protein